MLISFRFATQYTTPTTQHQHKMKQKAIQSIEKIDQQLNNLIDRLSKYDQDTLNTRMPGRWSVLDNLQHLKRAERLSEAYVKKKLSFNPSLKKAGLGASWRSFLLNSYARMPFKFKAPPAVNEEHFPETSSLEEIQKEWSAQRSNLKNYFSSLPEDLFDKELYKHPLVGKVTLSAMIDFFGIHMKRHEHQIERALKEAAGIKA